MRAILLILILAVVAVIVAVASGFVDIRQTREAQVPRVTATGDGLRAQGGQAPTFEVETGSVQVGRGTANVSAPTVKIEPKPTQVPVPKVTVNQPGGQPQPATNTAQ